MELLPFLIFGYIAFTIFKGFTKAAGKGAGRPLPRNSPRYREQSPTQRGRESLHSKGQSSPWGENGAVSPGARVAANYLEKSQAARKKARKDAHKTPEQRGRRGKNVDQNRNRTDEWGQRGDRGFLSGRNFIILLLIGGLVLFILSQMPAT